MAFCLLLEIHGADKGIGPFPTPSAIETLCYPSPLLLRLLCCARMSAAASRDERRRRRRQRRHREEEEWGSADGGFLRCRSPRSQVVRPAKCAAPELEGEGEEDRPFVSGPRRAPGASPRWSGRASVAPTAVRRITGTWLA